MAGSKITGKTYSLYGDQDTSDYFYNDLNEVMDQVLVLVDAKQEILNLLRKNSKRKTLLKKEIEINKGKTILSKILHLAEKTLEKYFTDIEAHLKKLTLSEKCDSALTTSREQYFFYMLEIELVNRMNKEMYNAAKSKYAFLPHCLHDLEKDCLSSTDGFDYVCKGCSKNCSINSVNKIMKLNNIKAYIWREADLEKVFKLAKSSGESIGAFGVACIPELVNGLRLCAKYDVPAIGVPLDANRCRRWMGDFYPNSVNEKKIISLLH
jgi:hypothetical protein